jgi:hypothetical protein
MFIFARPVKDFHGYSILPVIGGIVNYASMTIMMMEIKHLFQTLVANSTLTRLNITHTSIFIRSKT